MGFRYNFRLERQPPRGSGSLVLLNGEDRDFFVNMTLEPVNASVTIEYRNQSSGEETRKISISDLTPRASTVFVASWIRIQLNDGTVSYGVNGVVELWHVNQFPTPAEGEPLEAPGSFERA